MICKHCCDRLNVGMIHKVDPETRQKFKSCPHCSEANGNEHIFHPYPSAFGKTPARITAKNPSGNQSYCYDCRKLEKGEESHTHQKGRACSSLK